MLEELLKDYITDDWIAYGLRGGRLYGLSSAHSDYDVLAITKSGKKITHKLTDELDLIIMPLGVFMEKFSYTDVHEADFLLHNEITYLDKNYSSLFKSMKVSSTQYVASSHRFAHKSFGLLSKGIVKKKDFRTLKAGVRSLFLARKLLSTHENFTPKLSDHEASIYFELVTQAQAMFDFRASQQEVRAYVETELAKLFPLSA